MQGFNDDVIPSLATFPPFARDNPELTEPNPLLPGFPVPRPP